MKKFAWNKLIENWKVGLTIQQKKIFPTGSLEQGKQINALYQLKILAEDDWTKFKVRVEGISRLYQ